MHLAVPLGSNPPEINLVTDLLLRERGIGLPHLIPHDAGPALVSTRPLSVLPESVQMEPESPGSQRGAGRGGWWSSSRGGEAYGLTCGGD